METMIKQGVSVDVKTLNTLLTAHVNAGDVAGTVQLFAQMVSADPNHPLRPVEETADSIDSVGRLDALVQSIASRGKLQPTLYTFAALITAFGRAGMIDHATAIVHRLKMNDVPLDDVIYNALIDAYCKCKRLDVARELITEMRACGVPPTTISYNTLLFGYSAIPDTKTVEELLEEMRNYKVEVNVRSMNALVMVYIRSGAFSEAKKVLEKMKIDGMEDEITQQHRTSLGYYGVSKQIVSLVKSRLHVFAADVVREARQAGETLEAEAVEAMKDAVLQVEKEQREEEEKKKGAESEKEADTRQRTKATTRTNTEHGS